MHARGVGYDTFWAGEWLVRHFTFDSMEDYIAYLRDAQTHPAFAGVLASERGSEEFTRTKSLDEALELAQFGWHDNFNQLVHLVETIKRSLDLKLEPNHTYHDYVGFAPDVKAFLEGTPTAMINQPPVKRTRITIYVNTSYDGGTADELIYHRGAITLALAEALELMGYGVDLRLFEMSFVGSEVHLSEFKLKGVDERVNLQKLYFPLCHPSWVRRLNFRLIETSPDMTDEWAGTYGIPAEDALMRKVLGLGELDILIPTIKELKIEGADIKADASQMFERVNPMLPADKQLRFR